MIMKKCKVRRTIVLVAGILVAGLWAAPGHAQQAPAPAASGAQAAAPAPAQAPAPSPGKAETTPPDKVVLKVGDQKVTAADFDFFVSTLPPIARARAQETTGFRPFGDQYGTGLVLEQKAVRDGLDQDPKVANLVALARIQALAKAEYEKLQKGVTVSPDEIAKYYHEHPLEYDLMDVRRIVVHYKPQGAAADATGLAPKDAKARVEYYSKELRAGKDPAEIEKEFKEAEDAQIDTDPTTSNMTEFTPEWREVVTKLKDGEVSEPLDWQNQGYVALQVLSRSHKELKDASKGIETYLHNQKVQAVMAELKKNAAIWLDEDGYFKRPAPRAPQPSSKPTPAPAPSKPAPAPASPAPAPKQ
jgi:predicted transcriptional regulator